MGTPFLGEYFLTMVVNCGTGENTLLFVYTFLLGFYLFADVLLRINCPTTPCLKALAGITFSLMIFKP
jgi:hypothetical protein